MDRDSHILIINGRKILAQKPWQLKDDVANKHIEVTNHNVVHWQSASKQLLLLNNKGSTCYLGLCGLFL